MPMDLKTGTNRRDFLRASSIAAFLAGVGSAAAVVVPAGRPRPVGSFFQRQRFFQERQLVWSGAGAGKSLSEGSPASSGTV